MAPVPIMPTLKCDSPWGDIKKSPLYPSTMVFSVMKLDLLPLCACAALLLGPLTGCKRTPPANVAAMVNNRSITTTELEKTYNSQFPASQEGSSEDQVMMQKLELLRNMIDSEI